MFKFNKSSGQASKLLLVLAVVVLVAVIIVYLVLKMTEKPAKTIETETTPTVVLPVYEKTLGNIRFVFESSLDRGSVLKATNAVKASASVKDLYVSNSGAKFIQVTIGAQNMGIENTERNAWEIENIVDSQGRNFVPLEGYTINPWLPEDNLCGSLLKPAFDPTPCTKIYEVSKESVGLKIRVQTGKENAASNLSSGKVDTVLLDLIVK